MNDAPVLAGVRFVADPGAADDFERKHTPHIAIEPVSEGAVRISVEVGHYVAHPNQPDHYITWIALFAGDAEIARFDLAPAATSPSVSVIASLPPATTVRAVEHCNLHGLWAAESGV